MILEMAVISFKSAVAGLSWESVEESAGAHLNTKGVCVASGQAIHAVIGEAVVQFAPDLGLLLLARPLQHAVLALGAVLHRGVASPQPPYQKCQEPPPGNFSHRVDLTTKHSRQTLSQEACPVQKVMHTRRGQE